MPQFFFSSRRRHTRWPRDWSSDVCSSDLHNFDQKTELIDNQRELNFTKLLPHFSTEVNINNAQRINLNYRSEERRVGKECRSRRSPEHYKKEKIKRITARM